MYCDLQEQMNRQGMAGFFILFLFGMRFAILICYKSFIAYLWKEKL